MTNSFKLSTEGTWIMREGVPAKLIMLVIRYAEGSWRMIGYSKKVFKEMDLYFAIGKLFEVIQ